MNDNPFKIIEPREEVPQEMKKEVLDSVKAIVLVLRIVQIFVGDYANVIFERFRHADMNASQNSDDQKKPLADNSNIDPES
jgi:hypothetical protein